MTDDVNLWTIDADMKKKLTSKVPALYKQRIKESKAEEPEVVYSRSVKILPSVNDFTFSDFKKVADKTPFTLAEWALVLHLSERTLQRYAKNNSSFAPIHAERFMQINQVLTRGKKVFGSIEGFYSWLHSSPPNLDGDLSFASLTSFEGIQKVLIQIGRIEHGILA